MNKILTQKSIFGKIIAIFLAVFLMLSFSFGSSNAATINELQKKKSEINKNISEKTKQAEQKKKEIEAYNKQIDQLNGDISEIEGKINETENKINSTQREINDRISKITQKEKELGIEKANQNEAIRTIYENGVKNTLEIIIGSNTLSDLVDHSHYLESLENRIEATIEEVNRLKAELESEKASLEKEKKDLSNLQEQQEAYKYGLDSQKSQKNKLMSDAKNQKRTLDQQIEEAKRLNTQVEAQINALAAASRGSSRTVIARDRGTSAVGFMWPMDYKYISQYFGDPWNFNPNVPHTGLDLVNISGTPIYAAADGTVTTVADMVYDGHYYGYGKYIIIGHNARFSSLYGHLMGFAVRVGDEMKKGDIIGYEGSTGWSTGPHLHFEIWENGVRNNPLNYLP